MTPQKRRKDPTKPDMGGTRARAVDPESVVYLEAEPPPAERPQRTRRKAPPPLPRHRRRTLEVEVAQIEAEEVSGEQRPIDSGLMELLYAPCHAPTAYHKLAYRQAALLAAVDGKRTLGAIAARSGLDLESVRRGLESLCSAGLIKRLR